MRCYENPLYIDKKNIVLKVPVYCNNSVIISIELIIHTITSSTLIWMFSNNFYMILINKSVLTVENYPSRQTFGKTRLNATVWNRDWYPFTLKNNRQKRRFLRFLRLICTFRARKRRKTLFFSVKTGFYSGI
jgi:hypothetical protein